MTMVRETPNFYVFEALVRNEIAVLYLDKFQLNRHGCMFEIGEELETIQSWRPSDDVRDVRDTRIARIVNRDLRVENQNLRTTLDTLQQQLKQIRFLTNAPVGDR